MMKEASRKVNRILDLLLLWGVAFGLLAGSFLAYLVSPEPGTGYKELTIPQGSTLRKVSRLLHERQLISSPLFFEWWGRILGYEKRIQPGDYQIKMGLTPFNLFQDLISLKGKAEWITIPEGWQAAQIAELLEERGICPKGEFLSIVKDRDLLKPLGIESPSFEGYLFPDTYRFLRNTAASEVIKVMVNNFFSKNQDILSLGYQRGMSLRETVILASLVEKEAKRPEERRIIAGVFLNRLRKGMKLQSDPTAVYRLEAAHRDLIRPSDLKQKSEYNTYLVEGLPQGPICNPGRDALLAVINPAQTKYLYFVSNKDGSHHFSETYDQHLQAISELRLKSP